MSIKMAGIAATLLFATSAAFATDLTPKASTYNYVPAAPVPFTWTGLYVGASSGYGTTLTDGLDYRGFTAGGQVGFNYQWHNIVAGLESDGNWSNIGKTVLTDDLRTTDTINSFGTVHGRLGYAFDRTLLYGLAGVALANNTLSITGPGVGMGWGSGNALTESHLHNGYVVGAGIERALTDNVTARAEYQFAGYGSQDYFGAPSGTVNVQSIKVGVNYLFH